MKWVLNVIVAAGVSMAAPVQWAQAADGAEMDRPLQISQQSSGALEGHLAQPESLVQQNQNVLGMLKEIETLKAEVAKLRGLTEVQAHQLDTLDKRQTDLYADLDQRLTDLVKEAKAAQMVVPVPAPSSVAVSPPPDTQVESAAYEAALKLFREDSYKSAIAGFRAFLKTYPDSTLAPNAQYWIGYSYYVLKDYKSALAQQQKLVAVYPASGKVPDALLNIATNEIALNKLAAARKTLEQLVTQYPGTPAATLASRRLATLK
ncbi:MAG: tol-pal system protein YbgF [Thiobacillus sp.]|nr:tol-pal system protein YbgF [Thiobacillus sp.]